MTALLKRMLASRRRISTQLYLGVGSAVVLTITASLVGWFSFNRVGSSQRQLNEESVPGMAAAFEIAQQSGALVAAAPLLVAATTLEEFERIAAGVDQASDAFEVQLEVLGQQGDDEERFNRIHAQGRVLIANIKTIEDLVEERFTLHDRLEVLRAELEALQGRLIVNLAPAIDDQLFYLVTGYRNLGEAPAPLEQHLSEAEVNRYRYLIDLQADASTAIQLLASSFVLSDTHLLEPLRERFEATVSGIKEGLSTLGMGSRRNEEALGFTKLFELGLGVQRDRALQPLLGRNISRTEELGGFDLREQELEIATREQELLASNRELATELATEAEGIVSAARTNAQEAMLSSAQVIFAGRSLLLALTALSIVGAALISWLLVGRVLLRRLEQLSSRMRRMAGGDLEGKVEMDGSDEVADMAVALETFRRNALEVQRLNLVEKLAEELKGKNDQLEDALANLHRAQDQIVMSQKLAALGELTAGVAHEIRNPLNFIKNFSEVSEELLEELIEELEETLSEGGDTADEDRQDLIREISDDLTGNLKSIREHGERANKIVHHMLMMGRGSSEKQPTDINALLNEHTLLAYHSARAADPDFNLNIEQDFDPEVGELNVVSQELGRVFLNMVGNACHATDEKRRALKETQDSSPYLPTLLLTTQRLPDVIEVRIRDNGSGIPPHIIEEIFNPFFTTKATDQGTGLGLSLSHDIVREHGGAIRVESEAGVFTEMIIELPVESRTELVEDAT